MITLKKVLFINGASSGITGIILIAYAEFLTTLFQLSFPIVFIGVGIFLVAFAGFVLLEAFRSSLRMKSIQLITLLDALWVLSSIVLLVTVGVNISVIGNILILAVAVWVAMMAILQAKG